VAGAGHVKVASGIVEVVQMGSFRGSHHRETSSRRTYAVSGYSAADVVQLCHVVGGQGQSCTCDVLP